MVKNIKIQRGENLFRGYILFSIIYRNGTATNIEYEDSEIGLEKLRKEWSWLFR